MVTVTFTIAKLSTPGKHSVTVTAAGAAPAAEDDFLKEGSGGVVALTAIQGRIQSSVPYPDTYAEAHLEYLSKLKSGDLARFEVTLNNLGPKIINRASGFLTIKDLDASEVARIPLTEAQNIDTKGKGSLRAEWTVPSTVKLGRHSITATVTYDGLTTQTAESAIYFGELSAKIISLTPLEILARTLSKLTLLVESVWNEPLDVTAKIVLKDSTGKTVAQQTAPPGKLGQFNTLAIELFIDASSLDAGNYTAETVLTYADKETKKEFPLRLIVQEKKEVVTEKPAGTSSGILFSTTQLLIIALIVVGVLLVIVILRKRT